MEIKEEKINKEDKKPENSQKTILIELAKYVVLLIGLSIFMFFISMSVYGMNESDVAAIQSETFRAIAEWWWIRWKIPVVIICNMVGVYLVFMAIREIVGFLIHKNDKII